MDATLLETEYDAVIVGTGMAEAILAGALARVGKKVLHLDQNDYYGSNYASFPLEQFRRWTTNEAIAPRHFNQDDDSNRTAGTTTATTQPPLVAEAALAPNTRVVAMESSFQCHLVDESFHVSESEQQELLRKSSQFSIDVNPRLVLSSEEIVQLLIESGVGRYLEFAAIERTYIHVDEPSQSSSSSPRDSIWEVPCSKKDVFASKLLGMVEKRMLMKFLQFVADYGETHILGEDVKSKNERELALGRSLKRPQNKVNQVDATSTATATATGAAVASGASSGDGASGIASYLDKPFEELLSKHFKLSTKLQQVVVYCVALASFPSTDDNAAQQLTAREGLAAVYRYVASIGRFTGNAFLVPLYGVGEITQSFCRLCAVYGGIYVLRAPIDGFVVDDASNKVVGIRCLRTDDSDNGDDNNSGDRPTGLIKAAHVITSASYLKCFASSSPTAASQVLRGVFLLNDSLRDGMNRFMVVVPPHDAALSNPFAVHAIQLDHGAYICPQDKFLVQISMPLPSEWHSDTPRQQQLMMGVIQKLIESAIAEKTALNKTKPAATTTTEEEEKSTEEKNKEEEKGVWKKTIEWQAVFAMEHYLFPYSNATKRAEYVQPEGLPSNVWVCELSPSAGSHSVDDVNPLEIHLESACVNARAIFEQICPGEAFLPKSASAEQAEKDEMDDEQDAVLKAAQKLAQQAHVSETTSVLGEETSASAAVVDEKQDAQCSAPDQ